MTDFTLKLVPGLTLGSSTIESRGSIVQPGPSDHEQVQAIQNLLKTHYPELYRSGKWGFTSFLGQKRVDVHTDGASVRLSPRAISHHVWDNTGNTTTAHDRASLQDQVTDESSVTWEQSGTIGVSYTVGVEVGFAGNKASASTAYNMSVTVGHSATHSRSTSVGSTDEVEMEIPPDKIGLAMLFLETGTMEVMPSFEETWDGKIEFYNESDHPGPESEISGEELAEYSHPGKDVAVIRIGYAAEEITRTTLIPDDSPATVQGTIDDTLQSLKGDPTSWQSSEASGSGSAPRSTSRGWERLSSEATSVTDTSQPQASPSSWSGTSSPTKTSPSASDLEKLKSDADNFQAACQGRWNPIPEAFQKMVNALRFQINEGMVRDAWNTSDAIRTQVRRLGANEQVTERLDDLRGDMKDYLDNLGPTPEGASAKEESNPMPDYDDMQAELNSLESSWPGYEQNGLPDQLEQQLNRARANISDAANGDQDGLTGAINNLRLLRREAASYIGSGVWRSDLADIIHDIQEVNSG